jgi:hypothetical protein
MMDPTKPETLPLFTSLAETGWKVETGDFGVNGNTRRVSEGYRIGMKRDGSPVECRQLRVSHPNHKGFLVTLTQCGDDLDFSVQIIASRSLGFKLGRTYFYPGHVHGENDDANSFYHFIKDSYEEVYLQELRGKIATVEAFLDILPCG